MPSYVANLIHESISKFVKLNGRLLYLFLETKNKVLLNFVILKNKKYN